MPLPQPGRGKVFVTGAGKAAASLARGLEAVLGDRIDSGVVLVKHGHASAAAAYRVLEGGHPVPDAAGLAGTRQIMQTVEAASENDTMFFVLTGGASALLVEPAAGLSFADVQTANRLLVNGGAQIDEINAVRKHLSAVTGGRLRQRAQVRDVLHARDLRRDRRFAGGDRLRSRLSRTHRRFRNASRSSSATDLRDALPRAVVEHLERGVAGRVAETPKETSGIFRSSPYRIVASNRISIDAAARAARERGCRVEILTTEMQGHTHDAAHRFAAALRQAATARTDGTPVVLLAGGETTLAVQGNGRGGRNQEFALVAALDLQGVDNVALLSAGLTAPTDRRMRPAHSSTARPSRARARAGSIANDFLRRQDSYTLLRRARRSASYRSDRHQRDGPRDRTVLSMPPMTVHRYWFWYYYDPAQPLAEPLRSN